jgi:thioredoxin-related protein
MKKKYKLILSVILFFMVFISCKESNNDGELKEEKVNNNIKVEWLNYNEGIKRAKELKKSIVMDFYADWCHWCKVMDKETFSDSKVAKILNDKYICIRIYSEDKSLKIKYKKKKMSAQEFSSIMGVSGLPTLIFMDSSGTPITKIPGFLNKEVFLPLLNYINEKCYSKNVTFENYLKDDSPCKEKKPVIK